MPKQYAVMIIASLITACSLLQTKEATTTISEGCVVYQPIYADNAAQGMDFAMHYPKLASKINQHNKIWEDNCSNQGIY